MSRWWAGLGAVSGIGVGGLVGSVIGGSLPTRQYTPIESARVGSVLGSLAGAFGGAMIGAGGGAPKQVGTAGVGALPSGMGGGLFP